MYNYYIIISSEKEQLVCILIEEAEPEIQVQQLASIHLDNPKQCEVHEKQSHTFIIEALAIIPLNLKSTKN